MAEERRTASDEGLADEVAMKATGALLRTKVLCLGMLQSEEGLDKLYSAYEENSAEVETTGFRGAGPKDLSRGARLMRSRRGHEASSSKTRLGKLLGKPIGERRSSSLRHRAGAQGDHASDEGGH